MHSNPTDAAEDAATSGTSPLLAKKAPPHMRRLNVKVSSPSDNLSPCSQKLMAADRIKGYAPAEKGRAKRCVACSRDR